MVKTPSVWMGLIVWAMVSAVAIPGWADDGSEPESTPADERSEALQLGVIGAASWNTLSAPTDPEGDFTLLWGSAYSGPGALLGATGSMVVSEMKGFPISLSADLLYGYHRANGWAQHSDGGRIDLNFSTHVVRLPILARLNLERQTLGFTLGAGVEPVVGMISGAEIELSDVDVPIEPVHTTPTTSVGGVMALGVDWTRGNMTVPLDLRLVWNPFVGSSTEERFQNFESPEQPGDYEVAFDWQFMMSAGVRWDL